MFLKKGSVAAFGTPENCITTELLRDVYGIEAKILDSDGEKTVLLRHPL
jgi:ABC-type cobalamin/Fe3+-siderophores transport system ATPase subunit